MTIDKSRFGGELELLPEAEEMMAKMTDLIGCAVVIPEEAKRKDNCESMGTTPQRVFAGIFIQLRPLEEPGPGSEQVNGKTH